jgi:Na+-driven multidrug efflux pump
VGFNYGSGAYDRVKKTFYTAIKVATITGILFFIVFECFPKQLTALFGVQDALYVEFSVLSFRIFPMMCLVTGFQTVSAIFFQSIGKPILSGILSLSRQIVFLVPAVIILCRYMGVVGVLWAGPVADFLAFVLALAFIVSQMKTINQMSARKA